MRSMFEVPIFFTSQNVSSFFHYSFCVLLRFFLLFCEMICTFLIVNINIPPCSHINLIALDNCTRIWFFKSIFWLICRILTISHHTFPKFSTMLVLGCMWQLILVVVYHACCGLLWLLPCLQCFSYDSLHTSITVAPWVINNIFCLKWLPTGDASTVCFV